MVLLLLFYNYWCKADELVLKDLEDCKIFTVSEFRNNDAVPDVAVVSFITSKVRGNFLGKLNQLRHMPDLNLHFLVYYYPMDYCRENSMDLFLDVLLNKSLITGRPFKIITIYTLVSELRFKELANIMSPFAMPIVPILPLGDTEIGTLQNHHEYYNNIVFTFGSFWSIFTLVYVIQKFDRKIVTIFYDSEKTRVIEELDIISENLRRNLRVCVNMYFFTNTQYENDPDFVLNLELSNVLVFVFEDYMLSLKLVKAFSTWTNKETIAIIYNHDWSTARKLDDGLLSIDMKRLQVFVLKRSKTSRFISDEIFSRVVGLIYPILSLNAKQLVSIIKHDTQTRIFVKKNHAFLNTIASYLRRKFYRNGGTTYSNFLNMEAHLFQTQDKKQNWTLVFLAFSAYIYHVAVAGTVTHATPDMLNQVLANVHVLNANLAQLQIQIKQNAYHLFIAIFKSVSFNKLLQQ